MRVISVTGGKGGTGKTFVATNLAWLLSRRGWKTMLVDADVDNPCTYTFFNSPLRVVEEVTRFKPIIREERCRACGECTALCPVHALVLLPSTGKILYNSSLCEGCATCYYACPFEAIDEGSEVVGWIHQGWPSKSLCLVVGELKPGERAAERVVIETLRFSMEEARRIGCEYVVIDTSPGTSRGIYEALALSDSIVMVTEPTRLGLHDFCRLYKLVERVGEKRVIVVVNKYGVKGGVYEELLRVHEKVAAPLIKIPYDKRIPRYYARGRILVEDENLGEALRAPFSRLLAVLSEI